MHLVQILCIIVTAVFLPMFIKSGWPKTKKTTLLWKMICASAFVVTGVYLRKYGADSIEYEYSQFILWGLCLGWIGDLCLTGNALFGKKIYWALTAVGGISFLLGHIFYVIAFFSKGNLFGSVMYISFAVALVIIIALKFILKIKLGKLTFPVLIYAIMLDFMFASAVALAANIGTVPAFICLAGGGLLFVISDLSLALKFFDQKRFNTFSFRIINLTTYFIAQLLIANSLAFLQ